MFIKNGKIDENGAAWEEKYVKIFPF